MGDTTQQLLQQHLQRVGTIERCYLQQILIILLLNIHKYKLFALQLHVEVRQSMQQLSAIQSELRGNINFMSPGEALH